MAERSKAVHSSCTLYGGVGSNPTQVTILFSFYFCVPKYQVFAFGGSALVLRRDMATLFVDVGSFATAHCISVGAYLVDLVCQRHYFLVNSFDEWRKDQR
jgi:hypothetical protein